MSENKRRRSSSPDFMGRIRQSARHIETEAKEGARRVQHEAQERVRNMTPQQKNGWRKAGRIIGTLLLVFVVTLTIFSGIFMAYINSTMRGKVEVYLDEFETKVSTELYNQDPDAVPELGEPHLDGSGGHPQVFAGGRHRHRGQAV